MADALKENKSVKIIYLKGIGDKGAVALASAVKENNSLTTLYINAEIPVGKFRDEKTTELDLSSKGYKDADAIVIAELLKVP